MDDQMCFDCLQHRIRHDFSDKLVFSHGISDSALPFGCRAVVQMPNSSGEASSEFILMYIPNGEGSCLANYIDEFYTEDVEGNHIGRNDESTKGVSVETSHVGSASLDAQASKNQCLWKVGRKKFLEGVGCESTTCNFSDRYSCTRTITALAPIARIGISSPSTVEEIASKFLTGFVEDPILRSLTLLIDGKATGRNSINFLSLVGMPSFCEDRVPGCLRHPNLTPIIGMLKTPNNINLVLPKSPYTLENILYYSPNALKTEWLIQFLIYQLLSALTYMHSLGVAHGNISPSTVMLTGSCWSWLCIVDKLQLSCNSSPESNAHSGNPSRLSCCMKGCHSQGLYADMKLSKSVNWRSAFYQWWDGEMSNFEYLLILNKLAGRRWGDHTFHTVMPWVVDFSVKPDENSGSGWRDLGKSKWRLAKGDEQLEFTYSTSEMPHHVSDECLSELAVCSYKARRLPLNVLRMAVRSVYEPNEYPSSMQRLYQWTPDECIPEFYCDPQIFSSSHPGMTDLAVPSWAGTTEEFIKLHRDALESNRVSRHIHHWIDITFGYKMSGEAAVAAKNVMLTSSDSRIPKSAGRRQLFTQQHPSRRVVARKKCYSSLKSGIHQCQVNAINGERPLLKSDQLQELEEVASFCEHARHLTPIYCNGLENLVKYDSDVEEPPSENSEKNISWTTNYFCGSGSPSITDSNCFLDNIVVNDDSATGYQELLLWKQKLSSSRLPEGVAKDIFSLGCILAELYIRNPLFDHTSLDTYTESGILPRLMYELPPQCKVLVEACIQKDWNRRPSAKCLLESPYFPATVRSSYQFLAPLQLLAQDGSRLCYASSFAKRGALKAMGTFAAEMCAAVCLPLVETSLSDTEAEWAYILLKEFLKCLKPKAVETVILPAIQKILQATGYSHLKVSLLQDSFVREIWDHIGKQVYLEKIHPLVISSLCFSPDRSSAAAASVLLIGSSEELGVPVTVHQTILPLIHCFGKGLCSDGIDVLVRIDEKKPEPMQSWSALALNDCLMTIDGLVAVLAREVVVTELFGDGNSLHIKVLMQTNLGILTLQVAAASLLSICHQIGPDLTSLHVLPKLKELFDELAFSQDTANNCGTVDRSLAGSKLNVGEDDQIRSRMDLVSLLYPPFASLLGIEKLRQCCATWLLLEQFLLRSHNWKWENTGESSRGSGDNINARRPIFSKTSTSEHNPAKLLLNGVGWSIPQSQGNKGIKNLMPHKQSYEVHQNPVEGDALTSNFGTHEPWYWFPSAAGSWDGPDYLGRAGGPKDDHPWKIRASVLYSVRAHHGALRSLCFCEDEGAIFTAGVGPGFKGTVQKWDLSRLDCTSGYCGHEEVVNDICILSSCEMVASCDGTIHVWNSRTGKPMSVFSEPSATSVNLASPLAYPSKTNSDQTAILNSNSLSNGILTSAFDGSLYTCMHHLKFVEKLVAGTGNGCLRFIDVVQGKKLHLWRSESVESSFTSVVSSVCSSGSDKTQVNGTATSPSWIAAGLSSGNCRLLDMRSGNVIASWRAHDGYVTKLAAQGDHLLVSSSLDRTLKIWDLRRNFQSNPIIFKGHRDSISSFSLWGQDVISISRNKIGLSSLTRSANEEEGRHHHHHITPHNLFMADSGMKNMSVLSAISILPHSRLFVVGTEDGCFKICC